MATINGTVLEFDALSYLEFVSGSPRGADASDDERSIRSYDAVELDLLDLLLLPQNDIVVTRRSPGDVGYGSAPVVGSVVNQGIGRTQVAYQPGAHYYSEFTTNRIDTGNAADASPLPVAQAVRNGVDDVSGNWVSVTHIETGVYSVDGVIPMTYATGDSIQVRIVATVNGVERKQVISDFQLGPVAFL